MIYTHDIHYFFLLLICVPFLPHIPVQWYSPSINNTDTCKQKLRFSFFSKFSRSPYHPYFNINVQQNNHIKEKETKSKIVCTSLCVCVYCHAPPPPTGIWTEYLSVRNSDLPSKLFDIRTLRRCFRQRSIVIASEQLNATAASKLA